MELCYTSAPKGLAPGSRGFCTVAATRGMPAPLVQRLESLSGYRPLHAWSNGQTPAQPVNWAHRGVTIGGQAYSILSRIAFAGADYTQRSNKLAHHVALREDERPPAGPAWVLQQPGFMRDAWRGEPTLFAEEARVPWGEAEPAACAAWARACGDGGWAGVLAESFVLDRSRPAYVIYRLGAVDPLTLVSEAMALLPAALRWQVHFSTYFTDLPGGLACHWRFVVAGTPAAEQAKQKGDWLRIDLESPGKLTRESWYVQLARTGEVAEPVAAATRAVTVGGANATTSRREMDTEYALAEPEPGAEPVRTEKKGPRVKAAVAAVKPRGAAAVSKRRGWLVPVLAAGAVALLALLVGGVWLVTRDVAAVVSATTANVEALERELEMSRARVTELEREAPVIATPQPEMVALPEPVEAAPAAVVTPAAPAVPEPVASPIVEERAVEPVTTPTVRGVLSPGPGVAVMPSAVGRFATELTGGAERAAGLAASRSDEAAARVLLSGLSGGDSLSVASAVEDAGQMWKFINGGRSGVRLVYEEADALGVRRERVVSEAAVVDGELRWRWTPSAAPLEAQRSGLGERLMRYAVLRVAGSGGETGAEVQFVRPQRVEAVIGGGPVALEHGWPAAAPKVVVLGSPAGWRVDRPDGGARVTLRSEAGATVDLAVQALTSDSMSSALAATWGAASEPMALTRRGEALVRETKKDAEAVAAYDGLRKEIDAAEAKLPRNNDGRIDEMASRQGAHRAAFQRLLGLRRKMEELEKKYDDVDLPAASVEHAAATAELAEIEARLRDVQKLGRIGALIIAPRSTAVLADVEVRP